MNGYALDATGVSEALRPASRLNCSSCQAMPYETVSTMAGVLQMDLLDAQRSIVITRVDDALNLLAVSLP